MSKSKVLLIEDDNLLRMGLKSMIDMKGDYIVDSDVATGREGIQSFNQNHADIVLLDLRLPDMPGTEVLKRLREKDKTVKIIVLTACDSDEMLFETLEYGTSAYVLKGENPDELFLAIKYALNDDLFISPKLAKTIVKDYLFATRQRKGFPTLQRNSSSTAEKAGKSRICSPSASRPSTSTARTFCRRSASTISMNCGKADCICLIS